VGREEEPRICAQVLDEVEIGEPTTVLVLGEAGSLTAREHEVLALITEGLSHQEIADRLFTSPKIASVHVSRIITKLGVRNRTEAATLAQRSGLLPASAGSPWKRPWNTQRSLASWAISDPLSFDTGFGW
jgi:DNA-binding NarL/FixJ family response regulator